jgi:hypothetical protein
MRFPFSLLVCLDGELNIACGLNFFHFGSGETGQVVFSYVKVVGVRLVSFHLLDPKDKMQFLCKRV